MELLLFKMKKYILPYLIISILLAVSGCERPVGVDQTDNGIPPGVPTGLTVTYASDGLVLLEWNNNAENDLKGYFIYRSPDGNDYSKLDSTSNNYYFDDTLSYNKTYYYKISSEDIWYRESMPSDSVKAEPINRYNPDPPRSIAINARNWEGKKSVYLSWTPGTDVDISHFNIYKGTSPGFNADSSNIIGSTQSDNFSDTLTLSLYTKYYYKVEAVDKGGLFSTPSAEVKDEIYGIPEVIFPEDNSETGYFGNFVIKSLDVPADYKIIVQDNEYFGEFWSTEFSSDKTGDTLSVNFNPTYLYQNVIYYWRVATFSHGNSSPNSISKLYKFIIKP